MSLCHRCDSWFILQALHHEADAAGRWGISCWNLLSFIFPLSLGQGDSPLNQEEQGGGDRSKSSEEDEGGRKAVRCLLQGQPCRLLSQLISQEMEKLGIGMREQGEQRGVVN